MSLQRKTELRSDPKKDRAWRERGAERYAERVRERGGRRPLAAMSQRRMDELAAKGKTPTSTLKQSPPKRRDEDVVAAAERESWHLLVCRSRLCVREGCDRPAGPFGHHAIRKSWLLDHPLLRAHAWDIEDGVGVCESHHEQHETGFDRISRAELIAAGYWQTLVQWAQTLDARYFPGAEPVLSRLERDYPAGGAR